MCLLTFIPDGVQPDMARLRTGAENNPDGHGYAIALPDGGGLIVGRGLDDDDVLERFAIARRMNPRGPALFHSRIATAGKVNVSNCHPFYLGNDDQTVIAHNGILPAEAQPYIWDRKRSDTRILAEILLPKGRVTHSLRSRKGRQRFANWLGRSNKVVILTVNPQYGKRAYIMNPGMGDWVDGIWYSNNSYAEPWWTKYGNRYPSGGWTYVKGDDGVWRGIPDSDDDDSAAAWSPEDYDNWDRQAWRWEDSERGHILGNRHTASQYRSRSGKVWTGAGWTDPTVTEPDECEYCHARHALHPITGMCEVCHTCNSCGNTADYFDDDSPGCLCYVPHRLREDAEAVQEIARTEQLQLTVGPAEEGNGS